MSDPAVKETDLGPVVLTLEAKLGQSEKTLKATREALDQALAAANKAKTEAERLRKVVPADKVAQENKGLRDAVADAHKKAALLEKDLVAARADADAQRRNAAAVLRRFDGMQATFDTLQIARDKAQADRDQALVAVQKGAEAYHKLNADFEAFKKAVAEVRAPKASKAPEPAKA